MDGKATITTEQEGNGFYLAQFKTPELAIYTYYLESNKEAIIIDPTYDTQIFREFINKRNSNLRLTLLTHYHADFLAGHTQFEAPIAMGPKSKKEVNKFALKEHDEGATIHVGDVKLEVIHTPGHTNESSCYLLHDKEGKSVCLFTGDTLFLGDVGRPDLAVDPNAKVEDQAAIMFDSLQKLKKLDK
jgi:glyoxylase-like metal-dependent hydrolase (beta-lactamase superfamily II)